MATERAKQQARSGSVSRRQLKVGILTIPVELRLQIYKHVLALARYRHPPGTRSHAGLVLNLHNQLYMWQVPILHSDAWPRREDSSIIANLIATCRQIHREVNELLYTNINITVSFLYLDHRFKSNGRTIFLFDYTVKPEWRSFGNPLQATIWPFITHLKLLVDLGFKRQAKRKMVKRIQGLVEAVENGKYLKQLAIHFIYTSRKGIPSWQSKAVEALKSLRVNGSVVVVMKIEEAGYTRPEAEAKAKELCGDLLEVIQGRGL